MKKMYARIIIPVAINRLFTYAVPSAISELIAVGARVEVPFGKRKVYSGIVLELISEIDKDIIPKDIISLLDHKPIVNDKQLKLWKWMSEYYACSLGEILIAGLPSGLKLSSETILIKVEDVVPNPSEHNDAEYLILEALEFQNEITLEDTRSILGKKNVLPLINSMLEKNIILIKEELKTKYKPKEITTIKWAENYADDEGKERAVDEVDKFEKQVQTVLAFMQLDAAHNYVTKATLQKKTGFSSSIVSSLVKKGILVEEKIIISRLGDLNLNENTELDIPDLETQQVVALKETELALEKNKPVLLHGVTGSGKTRLYIELIKKVLAENKQVLYLLPEIALTSQFIRRLKVIFGTSVVAYHSRLNEQERVEIYQKASAEIKIIIGARSSIFLPFEKLGLIIVDESHDYSYKQQNPAPRYHARDAAIILSHFHKAQIILGSATPAVESIYNVNKGKFSYVRLAKRVLNLKLPDIELYEMNNLAPEKTRGAFSVYLLDQMEKTIAEGKQCLIFRNRRGYAPVLNCTDCGWHKECIHCDIALTYHKYSGKLRCHYCGYKTEVPKLCPTCGNSKLQMKGVGTQKLEENLELMYPDWKVDRMDMDTASSKGKLDTLIHKFESGATDVLVGTQMIAKGLDFENVGLVGVLMADSLLHFPDFRSEERAWQLLNQVAGRAGRKYQNSKVIIQTYQVEHPAIKAVLNEDPWPFYNRILQEREQFLYPPFVRFVELQFRHKVYQTCIDASQEFMHLFKRNISYEVLGPTINSIPRIKSMYIMNVIIKIPKHKSARSAVNNVIELVSDQVFTQKKYKSVRLRLNIDPY